MVTYDKDGNIDFTPTGFPVPQGHRFRLILVTHDKSMFYANDRRKTQYYHTSKKATPQKKGEGPSLMISDMLTSEWGRLQSEFEQFWWLIVLIRFESQGGASHFQGGKKS